MKPQSGKMMAMKQDVAEMGKIRINTELKKYRDLFDNAPIGIFQSTVDGKTITVNPALARMFGYDSGEEYMSAVLDIPADIYVHPERREEMLELALEHDRLLNFENRFRKKDGTEFIGKLHVRVARNEDGAVEYLEGFVEDVTEQRENAEALGESEKRYRSIFENTGTGAIIIEDDMTISLANTGFEKLSGFSRDEIEGKMKWPSLVADPDDVEMMKRYHAKRRERGGDMPTEYEFGLRDKSGDVRHVFLKVDLIPGTNRSVASMIDITSLLQAKRSLRESESKLSGILEAFEGSVYTCVRDFKIAYANRPLRETIGGNIAGRPCFETVYGSGNPCPWCPLENVFGGETVKTEFQNPKDGKWYYGVYTPIFDMDDSVVQCQAVIIDIHERKQAEFAIRAREHDLKKENVRLRSAIRDRYKFGQIVGKSPAMQKVYELILRAAATDANVIIYGESGTGKELVARAVHDMSDRNGHRFVPVNCGAIPKYLAESEFFGYKKGAFTGAVQDKTGYLAHAEFGTLFLDELGEIGPDIQVKLLRVLEGGGFAPVGDREIQKPDVRIIAATNRDLRKLVEKGAMREDFFYRVHIIPIHLPPLRERKEDIPLLTGHFMEKHNPKKKSAPLTGNMIASLLEYDWPGNVRELENTIQRFVNLNYLDFPGLLKRADTGGEFAFTSSGKGNPPLKKATHRFEKEYITRLLHENRWNRTKVAGILGIQRKTLYLKIRQLGIEDA